LASPTPPRLGRLFEKTGVSRQADLVKLVAAIPARWSNDAAELKAKATTSFG
jgi:hypothetical protein